MEIEKQILPLFSGRIREAMEKASPDYEVLQEIRMRLGQPILFRTGTKEFFLAEYGKQEMVTQKSLCPTQRELNAVIETACGYSGYAFEEEIQKGYVTIHGGHRIGLAGQAVTKEGRIQTLKYISSLNIRISHSVEGCARPWREYFYEGQSPCHMLIISPPGCGKTTILRDVIRLYSEGNQWYPAVTVGVADERSEIGGTYRGKMNHTLGMRTDVLDGCPKALGMEMLLRSMAPQVLAADEIGTADVPAIENALRCGCRIVTTLHGETLEDFRSRPGFAALVREQIFQRYILLKGKESPGEIGRIYDRNFQVMWEDEGCT